MEIFYLAIVLGLLIWIIILLLPSRPYSTEESLEIHSKKTINLAEVTVLIPARNEASTIVSSLSALKFNDPKLKIILVDDQSDDNTIELANSTEIENLKILHGRKLPPDWSGKLWALEQGRKYIDTDYLLLLDADIILKPGLIMKMLLVAKKNNIQLVSLMAHLRMRSFWEKLLMPAFVFFFKLMYPFDLSNTPSSKIAAAAGGCILIETKILKEIGGFKSIKNTLIDDCSLAKKVKQIGYKTWIGLTLSAISIRRYDRLSLVWKMISRTAYTQLNYSILLLFLCTIIMILAFVTPYIAILQMEPTTIGIGILTLCIQAICYFPILRYYSINPIYVLSLPLVAMFYLLFTLSSAYSYYFSKGPTWKERYYKKI
tara:strand:+ start:243 stop:1361 length:1119 start_codon:yes stop_codon:yes gene_type:complete